MSVARAPARPRPTSRCGARTARVHERGPAGQTTVLVFYPFAFSPVCTDQLQLYEEVLGEFAAQGADALRRLLRRAWSQKAFREKLGVTIEQLSDFEPKGATLRAFGVCTRGGMPKRALVMIGPDGVVQWS